jgi:hypothetical protein
MLWLLTNLVPITVALIVGAVFLVVVVHWVLAKRFPADHFVKTVVADAAAGIVMAAIIGPAMNHAWAMRRDLYQREWNARTAHMERLRPVLRTDAKLLLEMDRKLSDWGHVTQLGTEDIGKRLDEDYWFPNVLDRDLGHHFNEFSATRETVRKAVQTHDESVGNFIETVAQRIKIEPGDSNLTNEVAYAIVRQCMGKGSGVRPPYSSPLSPPKTTSPVETRVLARLNPRWARVPARCVVQNPGWAWVPA